MVTAYELHKGNEMSFDTLSKPDLETAGDWFRITYLRASTLLITTSQQTILTDPWFSNRIFCFKPRYKSPIPVNKLPRIDIVLISHFHPDHFELATLKKLDHSSLLILGPEGIKRRCHSLTKATILSLTEWERILKQDISLTATPAQHVQHELTYIIENESLQIFFGGDTGYSWAFGQIAARSAIDIALLPISGTQILHKKVVMDPADSLRAAETLHAKYIVPIHEGNMWLNLPPIWSNTGKPSMLPKIQQTATHAAKISILAPGDQIIFHKISGEIRAHMP